MPLETAEPANTADESLVEGAVARRRVWKTPRVILPTDVSQAESTVNFPDDGTAENS